VHDSWVKKIELGCADGLLYLLNTTRGALLEVADLPVLLSSDGIFNEDELRGGVDHVIGKNPLGLAGLRA